MLVHRWSRVVGHGALAPRANGLNEEERAKVCKRQRCASGSGSVLEDTHVGRASMSRPQVGAMIDPSQCHSLDTKEAKQGTTCRRVLAKSVQRAIGVWVC